MTMVSNLGWSPEKSKGVEANYHSMYVESDQWKENRLEEAQNLGYATVAFGLRVRCPLLAKSLGLKNNPPNEVLAEARTLGNAMGQSYGMLNNRTLFKVIEHSEKDGLSESILPSCLIHDASYWMVKRDISVVKKLNDYLSEEMNWAGLPEIQHPQVGLGGNLGIFYPSWAYEIELPNFATEAEIEAICS